MKSLPTVFADAFCYGLINSASADAALDAAIWIFDVDATLLDAMSAASVRPGERELLTLLAEDGRRLLVWSAGGEDYARRRLSETGIMTGSKRCSTRATGDPTVATTRCEWCPSQSLCVRCLSTINRSTSPNGQMSSPFGRT